jgi:hypothetical protein
LFAATVELVTNFGVLTVSLRQNVAMLCGFQETGMVVRSMLSVFMTLAGTEILRGSVTGTGRIMAYAGSSFDRWKGL